MRRFFYLFFILNFLLFGSKTFAFENITQNQIVNVKLNSLKAMNLVLKSYSLLNLNRKNIKEIKIYLKSALFFLNEASNYSTSYIINKKIDTLITRIEIFKGENFKADVVSIKYDLDSIKGNLVNYEKVNSTLNQILNSYSPEKNADLIIQLENLKKEIKIPLIDEPIENAKTFIAIAYDNLNSRKYQTARKSLEIALDPLINLTSRENIYIVVFKDLIYKSFLYYKESYFDKALRFLNESKKYLKIAYDVSSKDRKELIKGFLNRVDYIYNNFDGEDEILKEYLILIQQLKNL